MRGWVVRFRSDSVETTKSWHLNMIAEGQKGEPESVLTDVRDKFFTVLNTRPFVGTTAKYPLGRVTRMRAGLENEFPFLTAWLGGLYEHAGDDEEAKENLRKVLDRFKVLNRLNKREFWHKTEVQALLGLRSDNKLPSLVGFSLMRVSENYKEVYYADIISSILPQATINFIKATVSVQRAANREGWDGSVGRAIADGRLLVKDSFTDPSGVVATEDLIGGNVQIMMRSVYKDASHYRDVSTQKPEDVIAVVFCFLPIADVFRKSDFQRFCDVVDACSYSIRSYCNQKDAYGNKQRLMNLMEQDQHAISERASSERDFLKTLITPDTQNNPVGAVMGIYCKTDGDNAKIASIAICERFVERQSWFPDFLQKLPQLSDASKLEMSFAKDDKVWGTFSLYLRSPVSLPDKLLQMPNPVLQPLETLWKNFEQLCGEQDHESHGAELSMHEATIKIASDMIVGLMSQITDFIAQSLSRSVSAAKKQQYIKGNIQQVLALAVAKFGRESLNTENCIRALEEWTKHLASVIGDEFVLLAGRPSSVENLRIKRHEQHWQTKNPFARINPDNWEQWLEELFRLNDAVIPIEKVVGTDQSFENYVPEFNDLFIQRLNIQMKLPVRLTVGQDKELQGIFLLYSIAPLMGYEGVTDASAVSDHRRNPIINLVTSYYSSILLESERAKSEEEIKKAQFARGASHGLKNALEVPQLVFNGPVREAKKLMNLLGNAGLPTRMFNNIGDLVEASQFVLEEVQHLKKQAELFFWIMDPDKGRKQISEQTKDAPPVPLSAIIKKSLLRGLHLTIQSRIRDEDLNYAITKVDGQTGSNDAVKDFKRELNRPLVEANLGFLGDAIARVQKQLQSQTCLALNLSGETSDREVRGINIYLLEAVIMELCQNSAKAAFLSTREMLDKKESPFIGVETRDRRDHIEIRIMNSASGDDCRKLIKDNELANRLALAQSAGAFRQMGSGGIQGIWQVRMLCDLLSDELKLENPIITDQSVVFPLLWYPERKQVKHEQI